MRDEALERTFREQAIVNFCEPSYSSRSASGMRDVPQPADLIAIDTASVRPRPGGNPGANGLFL